MMRFVVALALICGPCTVTSLRVSNTSGLAAAASSEAPMHALLSELAARSEASRSSGDPDMTMLNSRLQHFAEAIHFAAQRALKKGSTGAQQQKQGGQAGKAAKAAKKEGEDDAGAQGHEFEEIAEHKTCGAAGKMGTFKKKVKAAEDCFKPCAEEPGCIAFAYYQKPAKYCELFSQCGAKEDVNEIRGVHLWAIKGEDGEPVSTGSCGKLKTFPNSKPAKWSAVKEGMATKPVVYLAGESVKYVCDKDTTVDGSKDGATTFMSECAEQGFYKPEKMGCVASSECGAMPCVRKAHITGKVTGTPKNPIMELICDDGYSLDGEKVVPGGDLKNALLTMECDFSGQWAPVVDYLGKKGKACEPFAFVPASNMIKMYNKVFEALFISSCNKELTKWAEMAETMPPKLEDKSVCSDHVAEDKSGDCEGLVDDLKTLFDEAKGGDKQGFDAKGFCKDMWDLLKMDEPAAKTEC